VGDAHAPPPPCSDTQQLLEHSELVRQPAWQVPSSETHFWPSGPMPAPVWQQPAVAVHAPPGPAHEPPLDEPPLEEPPLLDPPLLLLLPGHAVGRDLQDDVSDCVKHFWREAWSGQSK
jgi:hypothetical protein